MKLLILGATGATGQYLTQKALAAGHTVTALVRDPSKVTLAHPQLTLMKGRATIAAEVEPAAAGQEAVLSALGPRSNSDPVCPEAAQAVVAAMQKHHLTRGVWLSAGGVGDSAPQIIRASFFFGRIIMPLFLKRPYANHAQAEQILQDSGLEWTVVRPLQLVDRPPGGPVTAVPIGAGTVGGLKISREEVATFMVEELVARKFVGQKPLLHA